MPQLKNAVPKTFRKMNMPQLKFAAQKNFPKSKYATVESCRAKILQKNEYPTVETCRAKNVDENMGNIVKCLTDNATTNNSLAKKYPDFSLPLDLPQLKVQN